MAKQYILYLFILLFLCLILYFSFINPKVGEYRQEAQRSVAFIFEKTEYFLSRIVYFIKEIIIKQVKNIFSRIFFIIEDFIKEKLDRIKARAYTELSEYNYSYTRYNARTQTRQ